MIKFLIALISSTVALGSAELSLENARVYQEDTQEFYLQHLTSACTDVDLSPSLWTLASGQTYNLIQGERVLLSAQKHQNFLYVCAYESLGLKSARGGALVVNTEKTLSIGEGEFKNPLFIQAHTIELGAENASVCFKDTVRFESKHFKTAGEVKTEETVSISTQDFENSGNVQLASGLLQIHKGVNHENAILRSDAALELRGYKGRRRFESFENNGKLASKTHLNVHGKTFTQSEAGLLFAGVKVATNLKQLEAKGRLFAGYLLSLAADQLSAFSTRLKGHTVLVRGENKLDLSSSCHVEAARHFLSVGTTHFNARSKVHVADGYDQTFPYHLFWEDASKGGKKSKGLQKWVHAYTKKHPLDIAPGVAVYGPETGVLNGEVKCQNGGISIHGLTSLPASLKTTKHKFNPVKVTAKHLNFLGKVESLSAELSLQEGEIKDPFQVEHLTLTGGSIVVATPLMLKTFHTDLERLTLEKESKLEAEKVNLQNESTYLFSPVAANEVKVPKGHVAIFETGTLEAKEAALTGTSTDVWGKVTADQLHLEDADMCVYKGAALKAKKTTGEGKALSVEGDAYLDHSELSLTHLLLEPGARMYVPSGVLSVERADLYAPLQQGILRAEELAFHDPSFHVKTGTSYQAKRTLIESERLLVQGNLNLGNVFSKCTLWDVRGRAQMEALSSSSPEFNLNVSAGGYFHAQQGLIESSLTTFGGNSSFNNLWVRGERAVIAPQAYLSANYLDVHGGHYDVRGHVSATTAHLNVGHVGVSSSGAHTTSALSLKSRTLNVERGVHTTTGEIYTSYADVKGSLTGEHLRGGFFSLTVSGDVGASKSLDLSGGRFHNTGRVGSSGTTLLDFTKYGSFGNLQNGREVGIWLRGDALAPQTLQDLDERNLSNLNVLTGNSRIHFKEPVRLRNKLSLISTGDLSFVETELAAGTLNVSTPGSLSLFGSTLEAYRSLGISTGRDLRLYRTHRPSQLVGGHDNVGLRATLGGRLGVQTSDILSGGDIYLQAEEGIDIKGHKVDHVSEHVSRNWWGRKTVSRRGWEEVFYSNVGSAHGKVHFVTPSGGAHFYGTNLIGQKELTLSAKEDVTWRDMIATHWHSRTRSFMGGMFRTSKHSSHDISHPNHVLSGDRIQITSHGGDIDAKGTIFRTPGHLGMAANSISLGRSTLTKFKSVKHTGFGSPRVSCMKIYDVLNANSFQEGASALSTFTGKLSSLMEADNHISRASHMVGAGTALYNLRGVYEAMDGSLGGFLGHELGLLDINGQINPSVSCSYVTSTYKSRETYAGQGEVFAGSATFHARTGDVTFKDGIPVVATGKMKVIAPEGILRQSGFLSDFKVTQKSSSIGVDISPRDVESGSFDPNVGGVTVSAQGSVCKGSRWQAQQIEADEFEIYAKGWDQSSGSLRTRELMGEVDFITSSSLQDTMSHESWGGSVTFSPEGIPTSCSLQQSEMEEAKVSARSGIYVTAGNASRLNVKGDITSRGALLDFGNAQVTAGGYHEEAVEDYTSGSSFGIGMTSGPKMGTLDLSVGEQEYRATLPGVIKGSNLSTHAGTSHQHQGSEDLVVHKDRTVQYDFTVPFSTKRPALEEKDAEEEGIKPKAPTEIFFVADEEEKLTSPFIGPMPQEEVIITPTLEETSEARLEQQLNEESWYIRNLHRNFVKAEEVRDSGFKATLRKAEEYYSKGVQYIWGDWAPSSWHERNQRYHRFQEAAEGKDLSNSAHLFGLMTSHEFDPVSAIFTEAAKEVTSHKLRGKLLQKWEDFLLQGGVDPASARISRHIAQDELIVAEYYLFGKWKENLFTKPLGKKIGTGVGNIINKWFPKKTKPETPVRRTLDTVEVKPGHYVVKGEQSLEALEPLGLQPYHSQSFTGGRGQVISLSPGQVLWQVGNQGRHGNYFLTKPPKTPEEFIVNSAIRKDFGNQMTHVKQRIVGPEGGVFVVGPTAPQNSIETVWINGRAYDLFTRGKQTQIFDLGSALNKRSNLVPAAEEIETGWNVSWLGSKPAPKWTPIKLKEDVTSRQILEWYRQMLQNHQRALEALKGVKK